MGSEDSNSIGSGDPSDNRFSTASYESSHNSSDNLTTGSTTPPENEDEWVDLLTINKYLTTPLCHTPFSYIHMHTASASMNDQQGYVEMQPGLEPPTVQAPKCELQRNMSVRRILFFRNIFSSILFP